MPIVEERKDGSASVHFNKNEVERIKMNKCVICGSSNHDVDFHDRMPKRFK